MEYSRKKQHEVTFLNIFVNYVYFLFIILDILDSYVKLETAVSKLLLVEPCLSWMSIKVATPKMT